MKFMETRPPKPQETVYNDAPKALRPSVENHVIRPVIGSGVGGSTWLFEIANLIGWEVCGS